MVQRILIPTDFSLQAKAALATAVLIAEKTNTELFILHSIDLNDRFVARPNPNNPQTQEEILIEKVEGKISSYIEEQGVEKYNPTTIIGVGNILEDIQKACKEHAIDYIIMGSSGSSGLSELLIGSNTERIVRHAEAPVLVIKDKPIELKAGNTFVFASSLKSKDKSALEKAKAVAEKFGTPLEILYINTQSNFKTNKDIFLLINSFLTEEERQDIKVVTINAKNVEAGILEYMGKRKDAFFGIGTNGRKGLARFFNDSIAEGLVNHAPSSVFCFKI